MNSQLLTQKECTAMRGIAIIAIVLHNYCHFIGKIVKENEYQFSTYNNDRLLQILTHPDSLLPVHLLSYFGHYGVPVFLFLSGFGLVMKYEQGVSASGGQAVSPLRFLRYNYLKLLRMLIVGFSIFACIDMVPPGRFPFHWHNVLAQLLMYINILPEPDRIIWPGIYWFFGLMMELYIVYRLLLYRRSSWLAAALIVICWLLQACCTPDGDILNRLRYNCIGGLLPFCLGILSGRYGGKIIPKVGIIFSQGGNKLFPRWEQILCLGLALTASAAAAVMCFNFQTWLWVPVMIIIATAALVKAMPATILKFFTWFGTISAAMFVAHPIARKLFITVAWKQDIYDGLMLYVIVTIALSWAVKQIIDRIPKPTL